MPLMRVQVIHHSQSGLPEDDWVNDWHFVVDTDQNNAAGQNLIRDALQGFYATARSTGNSVSTYLSGRVDRLVKGRTMKFYSKGEEANFGSPDRVIGGLPIPATGASQNLPAEVALVLAFRGVLTDIPEELGVTRPAARRRGRVYLGPLNTAALSGSANDPSRPASALITTVKESAEALFTFSNTTAGIDWVVAHAADTAGWTATQVSAGHIDNAWDTQRRRGESASSRTPWLGGP